MGLLDLVFFNLNGPCGETSFPVMPHRGRRASADRRRRARGAAKIRIEPVESAAGPHDVADAFFLSDQQFARMPRGGERRVQCGTRGARVSFGLFMEAVDFRRDGIRGGDIHGVSPVVSRKLSAS